MIVTNRPSKFSSLKYEKFIISLTIQAKYFQLAGGFTNAVFQSLSFFFFVLRLSLSIGSPHHHHGQNLVATFGF